METVALSYDAYEIEDTRSDLCPIILIHGLFWNKFMLIEVARELNKKTKRKVFCLDLRNHGESPAPEQCDIFLMVEDIKKFMGDMKLPKVTFVCHSFSTTIAYLLALEQPEAVEKMVMVDCTPFHVYKEYIRNQVNIQMRLLNTLDSNMTLREAKAKLYKLAQAGDKTKELMFKKAAYELIKVKGVFKYKVDLDFLINRYDEKAFNPEPRGSTDHEIFMICAPTFTGFSDISFEDVLKDNPNTKLIMFEGTTHLLMYEQTDKFTDVVRDFLLNSV